MQSGISCDEEFQRWFLTLFNFCLLMRYTNSKICKASQISIKAKPRADLESFELEL